MIVNAMHGRCAGCGDPACGDFCRKCTAWADLHASLQHLPAGIDESRLRSARRYFARERARGAPATEERVSRLERRIGQLDRSLIELHRDGPPVNVVNVVRSRFDFYAG